MKTSIAAWQLFNWNKTSKATLPFYFISYLSKDRIVVIYFLPLLSGILKYQ